VEPPRLLLVGEAGKPHGLRGEVYVVRVTDDSRRFEPGSTLVHGDGRTLMVVSARTNRDRFLVKFEGIDTRTAAEGVRGSLYVDRNDVRPLEAGEYWEHDLVGCDAVLPTGAAVGRVTAVVAGPGQDRLALATPRGERFVPLVGAIVKSVDVGARRIVIDPPPGLLE
jgi:16S rRNA processing protein RimM